MLVCGWKNKTLIPKEKEMRWAHDCPRTEWDRNLIEDEDLWLCKKEGSISLTNNELNCFYLHIIEAYCHLAVCTRNILKLRNSPTSAGI